jgi:hypothetical protein
MTVSRRKIQGKKAYGFLWKRACRRMGLVGHNDGKVRAKKRAHATLLALLHLPALGREITPGVHLFGLLQHLGRAELDADPATLAISLFYVKFRHNWSIS